MNTVLVGALVVALIGLGTPAAFFLRHAFPLRHERPELLQNGLWFMLPFLLMPFTFLVTLVIAPASLIVVIAFLWKPSRKRNALFYAAVGELVATVLGLGFIGVLNTFFIARH